MSIRPFYLIMPEQFLINNVCGALNNFRITYLNINYARDFTLQNYGRNVHKA